MLFRSNQMIDSGRWSDEEELAEIYTRRKCFAYGRDGEPQQQKELLQSILATVELTYQNLESVELGVTTVDHYFDTLGMLTGLVPAEISTEALDKELIPSKRRGFMEFTGTLRGRFGADAEFEITSIPQSSSRTLVTLRSERRACVIDEIAGCAFFLDEDDGGAWRRTEFHVPFVSEQGAIFASGILTDGTCPLPSFEDSVGYHLPIIKALGAHAARYHGGAPEFCPIT